MRGGPDDDGLRHVVVGSQLIVRELWRDAFRR